MSAWSRNREKIVKNKTYFSFVCNVNCEESPSIERKEKDDIRDEFAQFVNASIHPPNELSVPRCYPDPIRNAAVSNSDRSRQNAPYRRSRSMGSQFNSQTSFSSIHSPSPWPRPRLQRESAQDIDDADINPNINIELVDSNNSPSIQDSESQPFRSRSPLLQRSAPGTPMHRGCYTFRSQSKSPSRADSDESGHLQVPLSRARGISLPDSMEESLTTHNSYLLRQFNIKGKKVIHLGDSYQRRAGSNTSINSNGSWG